MQARKKCWNDLGMCHNKHIISELKLVYFNIFIILSWFYLTEYISYRQVLVQNAHTHNSAATACPCSEVRNKQIKQMETSAHSHTPWSIACLCKIAQIEKRERGKKKRKKKSQLKPTVFSDLQWNILCWQYPALPFFSLILEQMTKSINLVTITYLFLSHEK